MEEQPGQQRRQAAVDVEDPFVQRTLAAAVHVRRYLPFYVFTLVWALMLAVFPTVRAQFDDGGGTALATGSSGFGNQVQVDAGSAADDPGAADATGSTGGGTTVATDGGGSSAAAGRQAAGPGRRSGAAPAAADSVKVAKQATGKTRAGIDCKPGVRQVPLSRYAAQCTAAWSGNNGGATYDGVTGDTIRIVRRTFPESANSRAIDEINARAGVASDDVVEATRDVFIGYFDTVYELYGRKIEWIDYESENGNSTEESQNRGREGACRDAVKIKKELKAFAVLSGSGVFGECAAELGMMVFRTGAYYNEGWYRKYHPFLWHGLMECERISYQVAEYIGKRLLNKPAKWAGDPLLQRQQRHFGTYVPDNDQYQQCVEISNRELEKRYGLKRRGEQYNYALDLSRFADQAAQAIVQFKAAGVTTVVLACDPYSVIFLTQAASRQQYFPEWFEIGTAANDTDVAARLWDQEQVDGHLWGMSQLGAITKLWGPNSEPGQIYKAITGKDIPDGTTGEYFEYVQAYNFIQQAGPVLNPDTVAAGVYNGLPGGAPDFPVGYVSYHDGPDGTAGGGDHTGIDDSREIYWVCNWNGAECTQPAPDGKKGTYIETYGGKRFRNGEWPREDPPIYPQA